jgi:16S rRNA processing protein RimM
MKLLATGVLRKTHGLYGYLKLHTFSGETGHLVKGKSVFLRKGDKEVELTIEELKGSNDTPLIKFFKVDSVEEAKKYSGWEIWIDRSLALPLEEDEFYIADLIGLKLTYEDKEVATVIATVDSNQSLLLEVNSLSDGKNYFVPFMQQYVGNVDLKEGTIELLNIELLG